MIDRGAEEAGTEDLAYSKPALEDVLVALGQADVSDRRTVSATIVYGLSELSFAERQAVESAWQHASGAFKLRVLRALNEASEAMFELNYREIALLSLDDEDSLVRAAGVELLWSDETVEVMRDLMKLAEKDLEPAVRMSALKELGRFILMGEYGDMPESIAMEAQELNLRLHTDQGEPLEVRRRALESLANSSHPQVQSLIRAAYLNGNHDLKISAIFAMGRTCSKVWQEILLEELESSDEEVVYEAVTACGQIQLEESVRRIGELALSEDREIQLAAIWALGEIGGKHALESLTRLEEATDDEETTAVVDEALDTASFSRGLARLGFDFDEE